MYQIRTHRRLSAAPSSTKNQATKCQHPYEGMFAPTNYCSRKLCAAWREIRHKAVRFAHFLFRFAGVPTTFGGRFLSPVCGCRNCRGSAPRTFQGCSHFYEHPDRYRECERHPIFYGERNQADSPSMAETAINGGDPRSGEGPFMRKFGRLPIRLAPCVSIVRHLQPLGQVF